LYSTISILFSITSIGREIAHYDGVTLRIRKLEEQKLTIVALSGRTEEQHLSELQQLLKTEVRVEDVVVDLKEVRLVRPASGQISC